MLRRGLRRVLLDQTSNRLNSGTRPSFRPWCRRRLQGSRLLLTKKEHSRKITRTWCTLKDLLLNSALDQFCGVGSACWLCYVKIAVFCFGTDCKIHSSISFNPWTRLRSSTAIVSHKIWAMPRLTYRENSMSWVKPSLKFHILKLIKADIVTRFELKHG